MGRIKKLSSVIKKYFISLIRWFFSSRGLAILLLAGITVNLTANNIDDTIKKQRYLELLEWEIKSHVIYAQSLSELSKTNFPSSKYKLLIPTKFYDSVLNSGYLTSIEPEVLSSIIRYYENIDANYNERLKAYLLEIDNEGLEWKNCAYSAFSASISAELDKCDESFNEIKSTISEQVNTTWSEAAMEIFDKNIDQIFNPTQKRLNSPILRLLMGNKALQFMK